MLALLFDDLLMDFLVRFFGSLLESFWINLVSQNGTKIDKKMIHNSIEISVGFAWSIEHAARNTAAAPFCRRSSLE